MWYLPPPPSARSVIQQSSRRLDNRFSYFPSAVAMMLPLSYCRSRSFAVWRS
jgi:hypothetical protein